MRNGGLATLTRDKLPARVYHYTSTEGLLGIVGHGQLRATDLRYLNDTSELHYGLTEMLHAYEIMSQAPRDSGYSATDQLARLYKVEPWNDIGRVTQIMASDLPAEQFAPVAEAIVNSLQDNTIIGVACFCEEGDLLSQWRGYGIGGVALGFDAQALRQIVQHRYLPLSRVVYGRARDVRPTLRAILTRVGEVLGTSEQSTSVRDSITLPLLSLAAHVKHPAFDAEHEYRLGDVASADATSCQFRGGALGIIPYLDINLCQTSTGLMPLREVRLAPGPETALRATAVRAMLRKMGYSLDGQWGVHVTPSDIPFRG